MGRDVFGKFIKGYTEKQWGRDCKELQSFIIKCILVRFTFDNNDFNALYQGIPMGDIQKMIENMLEGNVAVNYTDRETLLMDKKYF